MPPLPHFGPLVAPSFYDQESDLALRGGVATARLCEVVVSGTGRGDIDGGSRMVWMEGGTTLGAKEGGGGEAPTQTGRRPPLEPRYSVLPVGAE